MFSRLFNSFWVLLCSFLCFSQLHSKNPPPAPVSQPKPPVQQQQPVNKNTPPIAEPAPQPHPPAPPEEIGHKDILSLIENLITAIQANQMQKAYKEYTSEPFKKVTSQAEFEYFVNGYPELTKNKNAFFGNIERRPKSVFSIQGTLVSTSGDSIQMEYDLIKENGIWKIIGIKILTPEKVEMDLPEIKEKPMPAENPAQLNAPPKVEFINK